MNNKRKEILSPEDLQEIERRRAEVREMLKSMPHDEVEIDPADVDPENPPLTDEQLARLRPAHEVNPALVAARLHRGRGRPRSEKPKVLVSLRLDDEVIEGFRATGEGWQTRINQALRKSLGLA